MVLCGFGLNQTRQRTGWSELFVLSFILRSRSSALRVGAGFLGLGLSARLFSGFGPLVEVGDGDFQGVGQADVLAGGDALEVLVGGDGDAGEGFAAWIGEGGAACAWCALARRAACGKLGGIELGLAFRGWLW